jgi:Lrp/AsnC family leucine-responsive transcriptional regulator
LDDKDKRLISILQKKRKKGEKGRTSLSEIGESLGMSHVAVSKRLDKLIEDDRVILTAGINSKDLDIKLLFMGLETETIDIAEKIKQKYENCPRLLMFAPVTGRYNVFAIMIAEDTWSLESIVGTCSMRTEEGIRKSESWFGNAPLMPEHLMIDLSPRQDNGTVAPCNIDCETCKRYTTDKCVGCPSTTVYKGKLFAAPAEVSGRKRGKSKS